MRRYLLIFLVGCGSSGSGGAALGEPCDLMTKCDDGLACDYTAATPTCLDGNDDPDGDGIPNSKDHCPNAPGGLYDEDGDGIGDDCDKCPIAKPPAVPDRDGDDVDSPCDPDPDTAGDKILLFDGFSDPNDVLDPAWMPDIASQWEVQGGELVVSLPDSPDQAFITRNVVPQPNLSVETSYRIDAIETGSQTHVVSALATDTRPAAVTTFECGVRKTDVDDNENVLLSTDNGQVTHGSMVEAFNSASLYREAAYMSGQNVGCTIIGDNMELGTIQNTLTPDALGTIKLTGRGVTARFQWVLVVGRSNSGGGQSVQ
ncbi:MAG: hypothetical protein QM831_28525 [Kofleriaceae bacterium]